MRQLKDEALLKRYLEQYHFEDLFKTKDLNFRLYEYEKGEIINSARDSVTFLQFIVSGTFHIYAIRPDGSHYPICISDDFTVLGDMEFCGESSMESFVEAATTLRCVELPVQEHYEFLQNDPAFLRFLLHSIARKMALFSHSISSFSSLEERLLYYLEQECPDGRFKGVEATAIHLRCSRRQLLRLLKTLCERNVIEKIGKGEYQLLTLPSK